jgi:hypothetical protein
MTVSVVAVMFMIMPVMMAVVIVTVMIVSAAFVMSVIVPVDVFIVFVMVTIVLMMFVPVDVFVMSVVVMFVPVFMSVIVPVMMVAVLRFIFAAGGMIVPVPKSRGGAVHHRMGAGDAPPFVLFKAEFPASDAEFFQFLPQEEGVHPQIHQGPEAHVAGDAGLTVKMQRFHWPYTIPL